MSQNFEDLGAEWIENDESMPAEESLLEPESSAPTWDDEMVRDSHREISLRARRAWGVRMF